MEAKVRRSVEGQAERCWGLKSSEGQWRVASNSFSLFSSASLALFPLEGDALLRGQQHLNEHPLAQGLVAWQRKHGRHDLPWQNTTDPYRVWLSELMLQQTQVKTVLGYYDRFLERFPDVHALAAASQDDVFALWSGLGYYARARMMHACAQQVVCEHGGVFPQTSAELVKLPGIGPSTAAAIASFCFAERVAIFDGNVKRVLARYLAFDEDLSGTAANKRLHTLAQQAVPDLAQDMPSYTQGIMDLGATVCGPRQPKCLLCPLADRCLGKAHGAPAELPKLTRKIKRSAQAWVLLMVRHPDGRFWLSRRPKTGIWAGLHAFVMQPSDEAREPAAAMCEALPTIKHVLTHRDFYLTPWRVFFGDAVFAESWAVQQGDGGWYSLEQALAMGLPKPVREQLELWQLQP